MENKAVLVTVVVAALAALFFLFGGADLFSGASDAGRAGDAAGDAGSLVAAGDDPAAAEDDGSATHGPVLFGRPRAERVGKGSLTGRVLDFESSEPIPQATVVLAGTGYGDEKTALQTSSNEHGFFRYDDVAAGDGYTLHVTDAKQRERTLSSVALDANAEKDVGIIWIGKKSALEGVVLDAAGLPVAGADVAVHEGGGSLLELLRNLPKLMEVMDRDAVPHARTESERSGRFVLAELAPGPYTLVVRAADHQLTTHKVVMTSKGAAGGKVTVRLASGRPIVGVVVDDRGRAIAGARVACMLRNDMESVFFGRQFSRTDAEGRFRIESPPTQTSLSFIVTAEGYPTLFAQASVGEDELRFVLLGGVEVVLRVLEKGTERPVEGASLMAMCAKTLQAANAKGTFASARTDHRGEATFLAPPGKLQMLFLSHEQRGSGMYNPMMGMMGQAMVLEGPKDTTIKPPRTELVFHMAAGLTVRGTVKDSQGKPIVGARVSTLGLMGPGATTTSGADGTYVLENQSPPILMVTASAPGYVQEPAGMQGMGFGTPAKSGSEIERNLTLRRASSIAGRVVDESGRPLAGVEVKVGGGVSGALAMFMGGAKQTITNTTGRFVLDGILPGPKLHVMARVSGYLDSKTEDFEVGTGVVQAPDLVMRRGSRITVTVETPDGRALKEARVEVNVSSQDRITWDVMSGFRGFADVVTNAAGKAEIADLPDGAVTLTASRTGYAPARASVQTNRAEGDEHKVVLSLRAAVTLTGRIVDEDGKPLEGAVVQSLASGLEASDPSVFVPRVTDTTGKDGRFELAGLPDVALRLAVTATGYKPANRLVEQADRSIELSLVKAVVDPDVQKRLEAIDAEIQEVAAQMGDVKDDAERTALAQRIMQLQQEKARLQR